MEHANEPARESRWQAANASARGLRRDKKGGAVLEDNRTPAVVQRKASNNTGLPDDLKSGIENLSGHSLDDVKVHYNSSAPSQLNAHAYAQGTSIHVAPGQEKHLPHEAWHVVQQKQGRVKPTLQLGKVNVNDDASLEKEADVIGAKAMQFRMRDTLQLKEKSSTGSISGSGSGIIQGHWKNILGGAALGLAGGAMLLGASPLLAGAALAGGVAGYLLGPTNAHDSPEVIAHHDAVTAAHDEPAKPAYKFGDNVKGAYKGWREAQTSNVEIASRSGVKVRARQNRGAPFITQTGVGDRYDQFIPGTVGDADHSAVAGDLLEGTDHAIQSDAQKKNAATMEAVVGLAEEWRKHGAAWVYRAILRGVQAKRWTMAQVPKLFAFVKSANSGRRQVARLQDVKAGRLPKDALVGDELHILDHGSDIDDDGFESDEDVRKEHGMKGQRLFSLRHAKKK